MNTTSLVVVYHPNCKPSTDFLIKTKELTNVDIEYINIADDKIESQINIDVVPLIIINNDHNKIYKGKLAFEKLEELINEPNKNKPQKGLSYNTKSVSFKPDDGKKQTIDLSNARP
jgi:hypothetical protein